MLKLVFIDDQLRDESSTASIAAESLKGQKEYFIATADFNDAIDVINAHIPDLIILDQMEETPYGNNPKGVDTIKWIWGNRFCPVIVFSAFDLQLPEKYVKHPFVEYVQKGPSALKDLQISITKLRPQIESIQEAEEKIRKQFSIALRDVAPYAFQTFSDDHSQRDEAIRRAGRRRLAAFMDDLSSSGEKLASWEHYICPPISDDIKLGDVLKLSDCKEEDPCSFFVVLTPSCDLVASNGRRPKVKHVLVCACCPIKSALERVQMLVSKKKFNDQENLNQYKEQLIKTILTQGYFRAMVPLPCLKGKIPTMAAWLNELKLIPLDDIALEGKSYIRIASIDSPFRELISWAYLQTACRPGLPDRDFELWSQEIIASITLEKKV